MSLEYFQLLDNEPFEISIIKRDFLKIYHQQGAQLNQSDQNVEFSFGENSNYHQIGNSHLEFDITIRRADNANFTNNSTIMLTNNAFAYCFKETSLGVTSGSGLEHNKNVGQVSTIMRVLTSKDGDLLSQFDNIHEGNGDADFNSTSLKKILIDIHDIAGQEVNKGKIRGQLPLEHIFGFCKSFKKTTKNLGFHVIFRTADLQDIIFTSIGDIINVTINSFYLLVPTLFPNTETQLMFNESIRNNYQIFFDDWFTERRIVSDTITQIDIGSAQQVNSPKYLIASHQTAARLNTPDKGINISKFDNLNVRNYFVQIDSVRYPRDAVLINYNENDYIDQYKDLKLFYKEYVGEEMMNPFVSYPDLKTKYPIQVIDLRFQADHITPKKIQVFEEYRAEPANHPNNARLFTVLIRRREVELISDGNKLIEVKII